jgi:hypothetical protein
MEKEEKRKAGDKDKEEGQCQKKRGNQLYKKKKGREEV